MTAFYVIRRCGPDDICGRDCNCNLVEVLVDVDELTDAELDYFRASGTDAQRAELASWLAAA